MIHWAICIYGTHIFFGACNEGTTLYRFYSVIIIHE